MGRWRCRRWNSLWGVARAGGEEARVRELEEGLVTRYPESGAALSVVFFRADAAHDRDEVPRALALYREAAGISPSQDLAGLARMRWGTCSSGRETPGGRRRSSRSTWIGFPTPVGAGPRRPNWAARSREAVGEEGGRRPPSGADPGGGSPGLLRGEAGGAGGGRGGGFPRGGMGGGWASGEWRRGGGVRPGSRSWPGPWSSCTAAGSMRGLQRSGRRWRSGGAGMPRRCWQVAEALHAGGAPPGGGEPGVRGPTGRSPLGPPPGPGGLSLPEPGDDPPGGQGPARVDPWLVAAIHPAGVRLRPGNRVEGRGPWASCSSFPAQGPKLAAGEGITPLVSPHSSGFPR